MDSRLVLGVAVNIDAGELDVALVGVAGMGLDCRIQCISTGTAPNSRSSGGLPESRSASGAAFAGPYDVGAIADRINDTIVSACKRAAVPVDQVLLVGLLATDWQIRPELERIAARVSERSGVTVAVGFGLRDWAAGGQGRPVGPMVDWMIGNNQRFSRIFVHVDESTRLTFLPAAAGPSRVRSFEAGPGLKLLDALAAAFSQGRSSVDSRGMLAVQGRQIKPLVRRWATHQSVRPSNSKPSDPPDFAALFVEETLQMAIERGWSVADVLCTATHFIAACAADVVRQCVLKDQNVEQAIIVGHGTSNGFLLHLFEEQFRDVGIATVAIPEIARDVYEAVTASVLGCLTLDGIPANLPGITGARGPRILGQLFPGSVGNWQHCVEWMQRAIKLVARAA
jgi:anhydro-N-acetylmuramic acid kinase